jgi:hypothetical protein
MSRRHTPGGPGVTGPHKVYVYAADWGRFSAPRWLWYAACKGCDWEPATTYLWPDGTDRWGRPNWDAAFALGVAHLRQECQHV